MANRRLSEEVVVEDLKAEFQRRNSSCSWMSRVSRRRLTVGPKKGWPVRVTTPQRKDINQIHLRVRRHEGYCCEDVSQKYGAEQVSL